MRVILDEAQAVVVPIHSQTTRKTGKAVETIHEILRSDQLLALALFIATKLADILLIHQLSVLALRHPPLAEWILSVHQNSVKDLREPPVGRQISVPALPEATNVKNLLGKILETHHNSPRTIPGAVEEKLQKQIQLRPRKPKVNRNPVKVRDYGTFFLRYLQSSF